MKTEGGRIGSSIIPHTSSFSAWPHRLAVILACATLPLLFIGGLVTSKGAGLAVPDWPTTFGYNMFFYPWSKMVGNIFYEHSHRLIAAAVGVLTIALALTFWLQERRHWLRWLGAVALLLIILQGVIGRLRRLFASTTGLIYGQSVFGAVLRHTGERLDAHLLFAALVTLHVVFILVRVMRSHADRPTFRRPSVVLCSLLVLQLMLGLASYFAKFTSALGLPMGALVVLTTTHLITGSLMLATS